MSNIDKSRLIAAVAARLKIRLDKNDPAFVLVELNPPVLNQTVRDLIEKVRLSPAAGIGGNRTRRIGTKYQHRSITPQCSPVALTIE